MWRLGLLCSLLLPFFLPTSAISPPLRRPCYLFTYVCTGGTYAITSSPLCFFFFFFFLSKCLRWQLSIHRSLLTVALMSLGSDSELKFTTFRFTDGIGEGRCSGSGGTCVDSDAVDIFWPFGKPAHVWFSKRLMQGDLMETSVTTLSLLMAGC